MPSAINKKNTIFDTFTSGKLLLTSEYAVLDGALALATPVKFGQHFQVFEAEKNSVLEWIGYNHDGAIWFQGQYALPALEVLSCSDTATATTLVQILKAAQAQNNAFLQASQGYKVITKVDFPRQWGLGTSSTLIAALARWSRTNPYQLLFDTMGGSGYDIACAEAQSPIFYTLKNGKPIIQSIPYVPPFQDQLYFVYLEKKQNSRDGIAHYKSRIIENASYLHELSELSLRWLDCTSLSELDEIIRAHEFIIGEITDQIRVKELYFSDFWGEIKSLGAWGGDFVLATSQGDPVETQAYFKKKGFETVLGWTQMIGY